MNNKKAITPLLALAMSGSFAAPVVASGVALIGGTALYANAAHAAAVSPINPKVKVVNGSDLSYPVYGNVDLSWTVLKGINEGDTSTVTFDDTTATILLDANKTVDVKDMDGTVVGTLKSNDSTVDGLGTSFTVTYNKNINNHEGNRIDVILRAIPKAHGGTNNTPLYPQFTIDGVKTDNTTSGWKQDNANVDPNNAIVNPNGSSGELVMIGMPTITADQVGKKVTQTYTIDAKSAASMKFNCDSVIGTSNEAVNVSYSINNSVKNAQGIYTQINYGMPNYTADNHNPLNLTFDSCTDDKLTISYTVPDTMIDQTKQTTTSGDEAKVSPVGTFVSIQFPELLVEKTAGAGIPSPFEVVNNTIVDGKIVNTYNILGANGWAGAAAYAARPTAVDDTAQGKFGKSVLIDVAANDTIGTQTFDKVSIDGPTVKLIDATGNKVATLTNEDGTYAVQADGKVLFTPKAGFSGKTKDVEYQINDTNKTPTDYAKISVTIAAPLAPKVVGDNATTKYNTPVIIKVLDNDVLNEKGATWKSVSLVDVNGKSVDTLETTDGTYKVNADNTITFTPFESFTGTIKDPVPYIATDSNGKTGTANIVVTVDKKVVTPTSTPTTKPTPTKTPTSTPTVTPTPTVNPTTTPKPVVTKPATPVVGPTVQTDMLGNSGNDAAGLAGVAAIAGLMGATFIGSKRKK